MKDENSLAAYEKQVAELENIVEKMESKEITLDEAMKSYEKGIHLIRNCQQLLSQAEQKIQVLHQTQDGEEILDNFVIKDN